MQIISEKNYTASFYAYVSLAVFCKWDYLIKKMRRNIFNTWLVLKMCAYWTW